MISNGYATNFVNELTNNEIWLADNTRLLPRKQIRSKDRDAARIVLFNRYRE